MMSKQIEDGYDRAFEEGRDAYTAGKGSNQNPYTGRPGRSTWAAGWIHGFNLAHRTERARQMRAE